MRVDLTTYKEKLNEAEPSNSPKMLDGILNMNIFNSVFVDCTASKEVADLYQSLLEHNVNIITANKIAASGNYETYHKLKETAKRVGGQYWVVTGKRAPGSGHMGRLRPRKGRATLR